MRLLMIALPAMLASPLCAGVSPPTVPSAEAAWLGVPTPEVRRQQREERLRGKLVELEPPQLNSAALVAGAAPADMRGSEILQSVRDIVAFSERSRLDGNTLWGRISGSPYERMAAEYVRDQFTGYGLSDVRIEDFSRAPQDWPLSWQVTLLGDDSYGPQTRDYEFKLAFPASDSGSTPEQGIDAELVYVGLGTEADLGGRELRGKIAVVHALMQPSAFANSAVGVAKRLAKRGAVAVITVMDVPAPVQFMPYGVGSLEIPCLTLNGDDGRFLEEVIGLSSAGRKARMRIKLQIDSRKGWVAQNVLGVIPGRSDEVVMLTAHLDAFFYGANDNASGLAVMLALARHYARKDAPPPQRTLVFVATSGHHVHDDAGSYSAGVADLIARHRQGFLARTLLVYNAEHIGARRTEVQRDLITGGNLVVTTNQENPFLISVSNRNPQLIGLLKTAIGRYGIPAITQTNHFPFGDPSPFFFAGIPVVNLISSGTWYHSTADTADTLSPEALERFARASVDFLDQVNATASSLLGKK